MPTFIKTGFWERLKKAPKGYLNLDSFIGDTINPDLSALAFSEIGLPVKVTPFSYLLATSAHIMVTGVPVLISNFVQSSTVISGVCFLVRLPGNFTASDFNGVGLYRKDGDTLTLVAVSTNEPTMFGVAGYTNIKFLVPYNCPGKELLYAAILWNRSAVVTVPNLARVTNLPTANLTQFNGRTLFGTALVSPTFPNTLDLTSNVSSGNVVWLALT